MDARGENKPNGCNENHPAEKGVNYREYLPGIRFNIDYRAHAT